MTITETGVMLHDENCWRWHQSCALAEIERLRAEVARLTKLAADNMDAAMRHMKEAQAARAFIGREYQAAGRFLGKEPSET